jgi:hypothetical protein
MTADAPPAWQVCTQRCAQHWGGWTRGHPRDATRYSDRRVPKRREGGQPAPMGSRASRCLHGGEGTPRVAMRWKASLGLRGAPVAGDHWRRPGCRRRPAGVLARPSVRPVPERRRQTFSPQSHGVLRPCRRCGVRCWDDGVSRGSGRPLQGGSSLGSQPPGRPGRSHPPLPLRATRGGWEPPASPGRPLAALPERLRRPPWPWPLRPRRRQRVQTDALARWVEAWDPRSRAGFRPHVPKGAGPARSQRWAPSLAP